ncbi:alanine--tRNA ligase [Patescibacteria group bacterium]
MESKEIRQKYLDFFRDHGHAVIPSASLIPENDPTVLFTTAGMHPLVPFLLGEPHPEGRRLTDVQKCIRTGDIEEVGDTTHLTFFEMLGNWSLGDYFKREAITWTFEFLTRNHGLALDPERLYVTVFAGDADAPKDEEAVELWKEIFAERGVQAREGERIFAYDKKENWWGPAGQTGPCGPDSEIFYDVLNDPDRGKHMEGWRGEGKCEPSCPCGRYVEVGNNVFMEWFKTAEGKYEPLEQKNVDFGGGLERLTMLMQGAASVFETDLFRPLIEAVEARTEGRYGTDADTDMAMRVIADHVRSAVFMMGDERGVSPSNLDQGYVLRRLIRRAYRYGRKIGMEAPFLADLADVVVQQYGGVYPELMQARERVAAEMSAEEKKFGETLVRGEAEARKVMERLGAVSEVPGAEAFRLYESFGFPKELIEEVLGLPVNSAEWDADMKRHQETSRAGAEQRFSGGLADDSEEVVALHTATHLLHQALRQVLGPHVEQKGSNITKDRLRFDFTHGEKLSDEQKAEVERIVNDVIAQDLPVRFEMMTVEQAKTKGAIGLFEDKYASLGDHVKCYMVGDDERGYFSTEICGGPHVERTGELGEFRIKKEKASSAGVRRIKAVLD